MKERTTPIKSIRLKCVDCSNGQLAEVRLCPVTECPIWLYRMGKRPKILEHQLVEQKEYKVENEQ